MTAPATDPAAALDAATYRAIFRHHPAGVCVVTADAGSGPAALTATSLTSLSLDPPLVSFAVAARASSWPTLRDAQTLVVHLLAAGQQDAARHFATPGIDRFAPPTRWSRLPTGEPILADPPVKLRCAVVERLAVGDHTIVVAQPLESFRGADRHDGLLYVDGGFHRLTADSRLSESA
jgi:flavin reductase (DIM6/NTAB) family NADH-FMN oxidoreductase RutF